MSGPPRATAAVRLAVRRSLADLAVGAPVAAAVSGGADSLALAAGLAFARPGSFALVVDHGLQEGSAVVADRAAAQCADLGLETQVLTGTVGVSPLGPEARARSLRLELLGAAARGRDCAAVLTGHTLDDQAETVLLGLGRGSGARSLSGMRPVRGLWRRPLLDLPRAVVRQACAEAGLAPWEDPHNLDPAFARVRVRQGALPALDSALGPGVAAALARSARLLREDADALDALAAEALGCADPEPGGEGLEVSALASLAPAVRSRVLKAWAERACGRAVTAHQVDALRDLVEQWAGQGPVSLAGGVRVTRRGGSLHPGRGGPAGGG